MSVSTIHDILAQFRDEELHNRHLGDRFERLICRYLELDPLFADRFSNVWMWNEWPKKGKSGDTGIDIVAEERATGEFCGIQCKFYLPENTLSAPDLDSYFAALGDARFSSGIIISTTDKWGPNAEKRLLNPTKPVNRLRVQDLDDSPIDWSKFPSRTLKPSRSGKRRPSARTKKARNPTSPPASLPQTVASSSWPAALAKPLSHFASLRKWRALATSCSSSHRFLSSRRASANGPPRRKSPCTPSPSARM